MRAGPKPIRGILRETLRGARHAALILPVALLAASSVEARPHPGRHHPRAASDMDRTLARMAGEARRDWRVWQAPGPLAQVFAPATRERVAAPPFTGWGYGGTIPGAWPGF
ncbi:hypothetical protein MMSR116_01730 [Methylobacterium mesophilicum SR1.6/6]|uniref:Uncharacterized protein n=2 Tax=Methylobacterium mesophilicum TaxID=39956 RepID=A0A6B9FC15_9HYPH|nr:hypothetical protein MMSR116_01730 [Methylobacterium mesophilicum SR1.6/6]